MTPTKYNNMNELLAEFSELNAKLATIEAEVNQRQITAARPLLPDHANAKARLGEIEARLRTIAVENPDLFPDDKRTHQTPFGAILFRTSTHLEIEDEEKTILKISVACIKEARRSSLAGEPPQFTEETLLRTRQEPDLESLEKLSDAQLAAFGIDRKHDEKFSVKPLAVKADKLIKDAGRRPTEKPELN